MKSIIFHFTKISYLVALVFAFQLLQSASCSKKDDIINTPADYNGAWKVSLYFDNTDETYKFNGYTFNFNTGGQLSASNGTNTVSGTWSTTSSKLIINFGTTPVFNDLTDDWLIEEKTATSIKLKDDNPSQDDKLHFVKL